MAATAVRVRGGNQPNTVDFHDCRTFGHSWDRYFPQNMERPPFGWRLSLRCTRCTCERHDLISPINGEVMARSYYWPEGYLMDKGVERPSREDLRVEMFRSLRAQLREHNQIALATAKTARATAAKKNGAK